MTTPTGQTPAANPAEGLTPEAPQTTPAGQTPTDSPAQTETLDTQPEWVQKLVRDLRKENEKRRQAMDSERQQAEEKRLADEKKWQELAEARERERDELKPYRERYEALAAQQRAVLMTEVAKWPAEVRALLPGEDADVSALADAVTKARPVVAALASRQEAAPGQGQPPKPAGFGGATAAAQAEVQRSAAAFYRDF